MDASNSIISEVGKTSRGGLDSYDDLRKNNIQRVLGDFLAPTFKAKITFALDSVTFNTACVNLFPDDQYIVINVDESNQRIIIEPCPPTDRNSLKFANWKDGKNRPRKCMTRFFSALVYDLMGWNTTAKYRIMAIFQEWDSKKVIVFNLDESLQVFAEVIEQDNGKKKRKTTINMPKDWKGRFGHTLEEFDTKNRIDTTNTLITIDNKTGEKHAGHIVPKLPTPEELIHRPYGGIRIQLGEEDNCE